MRDVIAHCAAALSMCASGEFHSFSPEDNERDVADPARWALVGSYDPSQMTLFS